MWRFETVDTGEARLHVALAGDPSLPLVMCLHGFPEYWAAWREVAEDLARDHFIVVPDQRGYNLSDKPAELTAYRGRHLANDVAALASRYAAGRRLALAGHDWGASVAYAVAFLHPRLLSHLVIVNGVHPWCFQRAIFEDDAQRRASQYMNRLREPGMEDRMAEDGYRRTLRMLAGFSRADWMTPEIARTYVDAWSQPGAMKAMLDWYRASPIVVPEPGAPLPEKSLLDAAPENFAVSMPHLVVWGEDDEALRPSCLDGLDRFAPNLTVRRVPGSGHWILHEKPTEVAAAIRGFVAG